MPHGLGDDPFVHVKSMLADHRMLNDAVEGLLAELADYRKRYPKATGVAGCPEAPAYETDYAHDE